MENTNSQASALRERAAAAAAAVAAASTAPVAAAPAPVEEAPAVVNPAPVAVSAPAPALAAEPAAAPASTGQAAAPRRLRKINLDANSLIDGDSLTLMAALEATKARSSKNHSFFKVIALQSGYSVEIKPLRFEDTARLLGSVGDRHTLALRQLNVLYSKMQNFSCGHLPFKDFLKSTSQGDRNTLMFGLYAATYPGDNEFDIPCPHCQHMNKIKVNVNDLIHVSDGALYAEIQRLLDPKSDFKGHYEHSMVHRRETFELPESGLAVEIHTPSIQDWMDIIQWMNSVVDKRTGEMPENMMGAETIRTISSYISRMMAPVPGQPGRYIELGDHASRAIALKEQLTNEDGALLISTIESISKEMEVSYNIPSFHCGSCAKPSGDLPIDFETMLFTKLRENQ